MKYFLIRLSIWIIVCLLPITLMGSSSQHWNILQWIGWIMLCMESGIACNWIENKIIN